MVLSGPYMHVTILRPLEEDGSQPKPAKIAIPIELVPKGLDVGGEIDIEVG